MHPITQSIQSKAAAGSPALIPYLTAGFPTKDALREQLLALAPLSACIEVGVPFTDPMADGVTIQRSSRIALEQGTSLNWILSELAALKGQLACPVALMSYLNPLLSISGATLPARLSEAGVSGLIIPDLPLEESAALQAALASKSIALVQMVTPVTATERTVTLAKASGGFLYAVTMTGVTGGAAQTATNTADPLPAVISYLVSLRKVSPVPIAAGFGIRTPEQVRELRPHADALIVGSALIEALSRGEKPDAFLRHLIG